MTTSTTDKPTREQFERRVRVLGEKALPPYWRYVHGSYVIWLSKNDGGPPAWMCDELERGEANAGIK